mgnify:CR=1 FL=1
MPNPTSHMYLVHDLSNDKSEQYKSYLLLGSVSPDIRVITKTPRIEYHYFDLINGEKGDGIKNFITNNKYITLQSNNNETKYYVIGYVSHLIADENWTINVFRKIFMNKDLFPDFYQALFLDRALQIYLDTILSFDSVNIYSYFNKIILDKINLPNNINLKDLERWINFIVDLNDNFKNNPWDRLEFMAIRLSKTYKSQDILDFHNDFIQNVDKNINELIQRIPENTLDFYINDTKTTIEKIAKDLY